MKWLAITRQVSPRFAECELTHMERVPIDLEGARTQHGRYVEALRRLGCHVEELPAEANFPDSVFVEDTAVVLDEVAVLTHPGAASRRGEVASIEAALRPHRPLLRIEEPGTLDGGDVIVAGQRVFVGVSSRSNAVGIGQFEEILHEHGYTLTVLKVESCLHLKSAATALDDETILLDPRWIDPAGFEGMRCIETSDDAAGAANVVRVGEALLYASAYPRTLQQLQQSGRSVVCVDVSELAKAEGAVTCCSLILRKDPTRDR